MPRIRSLKPDFFLDEDLAELPLWVRVLYEGLWCHADKEGRLEDRPQKLKAVIFPYDKYPVEDGLRKLALPKVHSPKHLSFIIRYEVNEEKYIQILSWDDHQSPHHTEKESLIPPFNGDLTVKDTLLKGAAGDAPEQETMNLTRISFRNLSWVGMTDEDRESWAKAYPACDIDRELLAMAEWLKANPAKGKKSNYRRFITNWLARSQERGGGMRSNPPADRSKRVGSARPSFADSLTPEQKKHLPQIDAEFDKLAEVDPMTAPPRDVFRAKRLNEIERS
jgi:hypothetical protein